MKKGLKISLLIIALIGAAFLVFFNSGILPVLEKKIIFKPSNEMTPLINELKGRAKLNSFTTGDGLKLTYIHINAGKSREGLPKIVFCHGNDKNITGEKIQKKMIFLADKGYEIFGLDYRGYGQSEGSPEEQGIYSDVSEFMNYLEEKFNVKPENTVLWGHSLGAAIAIQEAATKVYKAIITEGGFTSIEDMRDFRIKHDDKGNAISNAIRDFIYKSLDISQNFDSNNKVSLINSPMLIMHAKNDIIVPCEMSVKLSELKPDAETFFSKEGTHSSIGWQDSVMLEFLEKLKN